jgi:dCTP deaminase
MLLTGNEIKKRIGTDIIIEPYDEKRINPNSYNLRLHNELLVYDSPTLDMRKKNKVSKIVIPEEGLILEPGKLYLGRTVEFTATDNLAPMLEGRSSIGRLGISVHATAGVGDIGFKGTWTLEISCIQPVIIYPDIEICQIMYHTVEGDSSIKYQGKYLGQEAPKESNIYREFEEKISS